MKSNQERSNGCLPPKKREILAMEQKPLAAAASSPATASVVVANDGPHTENLAWLASVASERCRSRDAEILRCPVPAPYSSSSSSSSVAPQPPPVHTTSAAAGLPLQASLSAAVYPQQAAAQTIQYAQLAPNVQFISSGPYTGYISSHIIPATVPNSSGSAAVVSQQLDGYTATFVSSAPSSKVEQQQQQFQIGLSPADLAAVSLSTSSTQVTCSAAANHQYIQLDGGTPLTVSSPTAAHLPLQLHAHPPTTILPHTLTLAPSQLVVQYADGLSGKKAAGEGKAAAVLNGEVSELVKQQCKASGQQQQQQVQGYEARHILLPAEYAGQNPSTGIQTTSLVLVAQPSSGGPELVDPGPGGVPGPNNKVSLLQTEKGGICLGKPVVNRASSFAPLSSGEVLKPSPGPHAAAVIQTAEELPVSLYPSTQPPIIGYITSTGHHQHAVSYHATLPQHLVIPSGQSLLIPVSGAPASSNPAAAHVVAAAAHGPAEVEASRAVAALAASPAPIAPAAPTQHISTAMPHAYLATALSKCEVLGSELPPQPVAVQAPAPLAPLPVSDPPPPPQHHPPQAAAPPPPLAAPAGSAQPSPSPSSLLSSTASPSASSTSSPVALPPFFMRGSIIQLADGELKRVEDLKTEDFIQSAEISSELKIDSSTVERIDSGQTPNAVVIQFAVGELKAQVCVEVLVEYPFFVFGQGWSSCCPDRTTQLFELSCAKLCVGDVCVSLTLRGIRNGSVTAAGGQPLEVGLNKAGGHHHPSDSPRTTAAATIEPAVRNSSSPHAAGGNNGLLMKAGTLDNRLGLTPGSFPASGPAGGVVYGGLRRRQGLSEVAKPDRPPPHSDTRQPSTDTPDNRPPSGRKRRWSAPERDQTDRAEEEPPPALPKPSFIPQEVKICIEGRSSVGI